MTTPGAVTRRPVHSRDRTELDSRWPLFRVFGRGKRQAAARHSIRTIERADIEQVEGSQGASEFGSQYQGGRRYDLAFKANVTLGKHCLPDLASGIAKDNEARELGQRFRDENARHYRSVGEVAFEEVLIPTDIPVGPGTYADLHLKNFREEEKGRFVGKLFDQLISPQHSRL